MFNHDDLYMQKTQIHWKHTNMRSDCDKLTKILKYLRWKLAIFVVVLITLAVFFNYSKVSEIQFSPESFKFKEIKYSQYCFLGYTVKSQETSKEYNTAATLFLKDERYLSTNIDKTKCSWIVVHGKTGNHFWERRSWRACVLLAKTDLLEWSKIQACCAKIFWPIFIQSIRELQFHCAENLSKLALNYNHDKNTRNHLELKNILEIEVKFWKNNKN
jgi:hypothetical protein